MFSAAASIAMGTPRPFILEYLASNPTVVLQIRAIAISHVDMHLESATDLLPSLQNWPALEELILCFFEKGEHNPSSRIEKLPRTKVMQIGLVNVEDVGEPGEGGMVRGRYAMRVLEQKSELANKLNGELKVEEKRRLNEEGKVWRAPRVSARLTRFMSVDRDIGSLSNER